MELRNFGYSKFSISNVSNLFLNISRIIGAQFKSRIPRKYRRPRSIPCTRCWWIFNDLTLVDKRCNTWSKKLSNDYPRCEYFFVLPADPTKAVVDTSRWPTLCFSIIPNKLVLKWATNIFQGFGKGGGIFAYTLSGVILLLNMTVNLLNDVPFTSFDRTSYMLLHIVVFITVFFLQKVANNLFVRMGKFTTSPFYYRSRGCETCPPFDFLFPGETINQSIFYQDHALGSG